MILVIDDNDNSKTQLVCKVFSIIYVYHYQETKQLLNIFFF
jgi:hypothetical protein